jgi:hypothetical protein
MIPLMLRVVWIPPTHRMFVSQEIFPIHQPLDLLPPSSVTLNSTPSLDNLEDHVIHYQLRSCVIHSNMHSLGGLLGLGQKTYSRIE